MFTLWYICTLVACDSRYTLSTVRKLTPRAAAVLSRGLSIVIQILPTFFSISPFRKMSLLYIILLLFCLMAYIFRIY